MDIATLGIEIDPTTAAAGGAQFLAVLNNLLATADKLALAADKMGQSVGAAATGAASNLSKVVPVATAAAASVATISPAADQAKASVSAIGGSAPNLSKLEQSSAALGAQMANLNKISMSGAGGIKQFHSEIAVGTTKSSGLVSELTEAMERNASSASTMLRAIGPLGGSASELADRLERATLALGRMTSAASDHVSKQGLLTAAYRSGAIESANMEAVETRLSNARKNAIAAENIYKSALDNVKKTIGDTTQAENIAILAKQKFVTANNELTESEKLSEQAQRAGGAGLAASIAVIGGVIAALIGMAAAIYAADKAWELFKDSIQAAADIETARVKLEGLIGSVGHARDLFEQLRSISTQSGGLFQLGDLSAVAGQLYSMGSSFDNLIPRIKAFSEISAATGKPLAEVASSFNRIILLLGEDSNSIVRSLNELQQTGVPIVAMLSQSLGKSQEEIIAMFQRGSIHIPDISKAFIDAASEGGKFFGQMEAHSNTFNGLIGQIRAHWEDIKAAFGAPIIVALEPILQRLLPLSDTVENRAKLLGEAVARVFTKIGEIAQNDPWGALVAAFELGVIAMEKFLAEGFGKLFSNIGPALAKSMWEGFKAQWDSLTHGRIGDVLTSDEGMKSFLKNVMPHTQQDENTLNQKVKDNVDALVGAWRDPAVSTAIDDVMKAILPNSVKELMGMPLAAQQPFSVVTAGRPSDNGVRTADAFPNYDKAVTDAQLIAKHIQDVTDLQKLLNTDTTEYKNRLDELNKALIKNLADPLSHIKDITDQDKTEAEKRLDIWRSEEAARQHLFAQTEEKIKAGLVSETDAFVFGAQQAARAWGNSFQQMQKLGGDILNEFANDFSTAISDTVTGAKKAQDAWRDFAVSFLRDVSNMIIKALVLQGIQALMGNNSLFGNIGQSSGLVTGATAMTTASATMGTAAVTLSTSMTAAGAVLDASAAALTTAATYLAAVQTVSSVGSVAHTGAIIGQTTTPTRSLSYSDIASAPRFHAGSGMRPNEVLSVLERGEGVFTRRQMAHLMPVRTDVFSSDQLQAMALHHANRGRGPRPTPTPTPNPNPVEGDPTIPGSPIEPTPIPGTVQRNAIFDPFSGGGSSVSLPSSPGAPSGPTFGVGPGFGPIVTSGPIGGGVPPAGDTTVIIPSSPNFDPDTGGPWTPPDALPGTGDTPPPNSGPTILDTIRSEIPGINTPSGSTPSGPDADPYGGIPNAPWDSAGPFAGGNTNPANPGFVSSQAHPYEALGQGGWSGTGASFNFLMHHQELHAGGIAGRDAVMRFIDSLPRYHDGGIGPGEQVIVKHENEGVFTPEQMAHLAPVSRSGGNQQTFAQSNQFTIQTVIQGGTGSAQSNTKTAKGDPDARTVSDVLNRKIKTAIADECRTGGAIDNFLRSRGS